MDRGTILGAPYVASANVPTDMLFAIDADDYTAWLPPAEVDVSQTATLVLANDDGVAPTMADTNAVSVPGSIQVSDAAMTVPPTQVRSTFQTYSTALRVVQPVEWGTLRTGRTSYLSAVGW